MMDHAASASYAAKGLSPEAVERSRKKHGTNELTRHKRITFFQQFLSNFGDPIIKILLAALVLNVLFLFRDANWFETLGIALAIFLATFVSTLSEYGSESAFLKLQEEAARGQCRVLRQGRVQQIPVADVVVGDLVLLGAGERVPADGILVRGRLSVDQAALNGESKEKSKQPGGPGPTEGGWDFLSENQLFRGSVVCSGDGILQVLRVGDATFYGGMAREMQEETRESPLKLRLSHLAEVLSRLGFVAAAAVAVADLFNAFVLDCRMDPQLIAQLLHSPGQVVSLVLHALTLALTVIVMAVPEGLPMMITVVLSSNMRRMLKDHVLVRKLVGIETSGSLNILFTDKTGTLTRGKLQVAEFITGSGKSFSGAEQLRTRAAEVFRLAALNCVCNNEAMLSATGRPLGGNATDRALLSFVMPYARPFLQIPVEERIPFDSTNKFSAATVPSGDQPVHLVKGAPEKILPGCTHCIDEQGRRVPLSPGAAEDQWKRMTRHAIRVLALAYSNGPVHPAGAFSGLTLIGLVGIRDELRPEVPQAVASMAQAGIQVVMITGDNRDTAGAIALEAGLITSPEDLVLTSAELSSLSDEDLKKNLKHLRVVARALPQDKSRLVRLAQELGLVAGMTGDGINDAPALKRADVGFAMGSGTEVAKEAGDIVILDDNFASIVRAILYGRTIFKSMRKFIVFQLTMNLCAVGVSVIAPFLGIDTPITVIQMLWVNIIMDTLAGLAYAGEPPLPEYMEEPPKRRDEPIFNSAMLQQVVCMGLYTIFLCLCFLKLPLIRRLFHFETDPVYLLTGFFALFIFCGVFNSFNARTERLNLLAHLRGNPLFLVIMVAIGLIQVALLYYGGTLFRTVPLEPSSFVLVLAGAFSVIPADLLRKYAQSLLRQGLAPR